MSSQRGACGTGPTDQWVGDLKIRSRALIICAFLLVSSVALLLQATPAQAQTATLTVTKSPSPSSVPEPGGSVTFNVSVTNNDSVPVRLTALTDSRFGSVLNASNSSCSSVAAASIASAGSYSCSYTRQVTGDGGDSVTNTASATAELIAGGSPRSGTSPVATVTVTNVVPSITVEKTASPTSRAAPGGDFQMTVKVTNNTGEAVTLTTLSDNQAGNLNGQGSCDTGGTIAGNSSYTCTFTETFFGNSGATQTDVVTATATDDEGGTDTETDSAVITISNTAPTITVTKTANPTSRPAPGGTFTMTVEVRNTDNESVDLTGLTDNLEGNLDGKGSCDVPRSIAAGATYTCAFDVTFTGVSGASRTNTVTATATDNEDVTVTATDDATITLTGATPAPTLTQIPFNPFNPLNPLIPQNPFLPIGSAETGRGPIVINNNNSSSSSSSAAASASGGVVAAPPATPPTLVRTGIEALPMAAGGLAILLLGFVMLTAGRRKMVYGNIN